MTTLLILVACGQLATVVAIAWLAVRLTRFETVVSLRLPVPVPAAPRARPPGPAMTAQACPHPVQQRVDASVLGREQFLCLACDATVPKVKE